MKKRKILGGIIALVVLSTFIGVVSAAGNGEELITASLAKGLHVQANGQELVMTDWSGQQLYPIIYNGNTYLPARAIGNALNAVVDWDEESRTVSVGGAVGTANVGTIKSTIGTEDDNIGWIQTTSKDGVILSHDRAPILILDVGEYEGHDRIKATSYCVAYDMMDINIGGRQQTQDCRVGNDDWENPVTVIFEDAEAGKVLHIETLEPAELKTVEIPVSGVKIMRVTRTALQKDENG